MKITDFRITNTPKLDHLLQECVDAVLMGQKMKPGFFGWVGSCVLDNDGRLVWGVNHLTSDRKRTHGEIVALERYRDRWGEPAPGSIIITTCSPCSEPMNDRDHDSCVDVISDTDIRKVYCGYMDPTQIIGSTYKHKKFHLQCTRNPQLLAECRKLASNWLGKKAI
jgi:pyrimidine deaminase RibD-like protein